MREAGATGAGEQHCKRYVEKLKIHTAAMRSHKFAEAANSGGEDSKQCESRRGRWRGEVAERERSL